MKLSVTRQQKRLLDILHKFNNNGQFAINWNNATQAYELHFKYNDNELITIDTTETDYNFNLIACYEKENIYFNYNDIDINPHYKKYDIEELEDIPHDPEDNIKITQEEKHFLKNILKFFPNSTIRFIKHRKSIEMLINYYINKDYTIVLTYKGNKIKFTNCEDYHTYYYEDFTTK